MITAHFQTNRFKAVLSNIFASTIVSCDIISTVKVANGLGTPQLIALIENLTSLSYSIKARSSVI
jgi:hypothetical protein